MSVKLIFIALALVTCGPLSSSDMPDLNDTAAVKAAILKLNPIPPGGDARKAGERHLGQPGSDRYYFVQWMKRYETENFQRSEDIDYAPAPVPASIADAIAEQRELETRDAASYAIAKKRREATQAAEQLKMEAYAREAEERSAASIRRSTESAAQRGQVYADRRDEFDKCAAERFKAQAAGRLEDQAAIYQSHNCDRLLQPPD